MRVATTTPYPDTLPLLRSRVGDYLELTKPRVLVLVLFTVAAGALLAVGGLPDGWLVLNAVAGTALVAAGASSLNQFLERNTDVLMRRTENRPLPSGRLLPAEVAVFGTALGVGGVVYLALMLPHPLAAAVAGLTFVSYVFVYTPLKRVTTLNTLVGAVPGALPPLIGWTAVRGGIDRDALVLFFILFLWQVPHFLAIAWIYREDYARAGLRMLPGVDADGAMTGRQMVAYCLALLAVSLVPALTGLAGSVYLGGALLLGLGFLARAVGFARLHSNRRARRVLRASLLYLPALFALLLLSLVH